MAGPTGNGKVDICGLRVDAVDYEEVLARVTNSVEAFHTGRPGRPLAVFPINLDLVAKASRDPVFKWELNSADLLLADGMPLIWMASCLGSPLPERVAGSDLLPRLAARAAKHGFSIFLLGSAPGVAARAAERLLRENPGLHICGTLSPPFGFENDARERDRIVTTLSKSSPDIVFVGLGAPKQERWILLERERIPAAAFIAIGGTFDMLADRIRRAPRLLQQLGLEWAWRLAHEPTRLARRYLLEDPAVLLLYARQLRRSRKFDAQRHSL